MRISEISESSYPKKSFVLRDGRTITISAHDEYKEFQHEEDDPMLCIYAMIGDQLVGHGEFDPNDGFFRGVETLKPYRRQGVASAMYDYVEDRAFTIRPSPHQEPDGIAFWNARHGMKERQR